MPMRVRAIRQLATPPAPALVGHWTERDTKSSTTARQENKMEVGDRVYVKGPRFSYSGKFAGEICEVVAISRNVYPDNPPGERDLIRVALDSDLFDRIDALGFSLDHKFWTLGQVNPTEWPGDDRFGLLFYETELEAYPVSPVVG